MQGESVGDLKDIFSAMIRSANWGIASMMGGLLLPVAVAQRLTDVAEGSAEDHLATVYFGLFIASAMLGLPELGRRVPETLRFWFIDSYLGIFALGVVAGLVTSLAYAFSLLPVPFWAHVTIQVALGVGNFLLLGLIVVRST